MSKSSVWCSRAPLAATIGDRPCCAAPLAAQRDNRIELAHETDAGSATVPARTPGRPLLQESVVGTTVGVHSPAVWQRLRHRNAPEIQARRTSKSACGVSLFAAFTRSGDGCSTFIAVGYEADAAALLVTVREPRCSTRRCDGRARVAVPVGAQCLGGDVLLKRKRVARHLRRGPRRRPSFARPEVIARRQFRGPSRPTVWGTPRPERGGSCGGEHNKVAEWGDRTSMRDHRRTPCRGRARPRARRCVNRADVRVLATEC